MTSAIATSDRLRDRLARHLAPVWNRHAKVEVFDGAFYRGFYADLGAITGPRALRRHYREHGRNEGRFPTEQALRARFGPELDAIPADFDPNGYRDLNPDLAGMSDACARVHFVAFGRTEGRRYRADRIAGFDPEHFREIRPAYRFTDDETCYAAWLRLGGTDGVPGTQAAHLDRLGLPLSVFPTAFPWRFYTRLHPRIAIHRWWALTHFLNQGFSESCAILPYGPGAAAFLTAVGDRFARAGDGAAVQAYERAAATGAMPVGGRIRMAAAYARFGAWRPAFDLYEALIREGEHGPDVLHGLVEAAAATEAWDRAFAALAPVRKQSPAFGEAVVREAAERHFASSSRLAQSHFADDRPADGHAILAAGIARIADLLTAPPRRGGGRAKASRLVVVLAADGLPEASRARLEGRAGPLAEAGYAVRIFAPGEVEAFAAAIPGAAAAILFRMPAWPSVVGAVLDARRAGVPTLYEADELTFDPAHAPGPLAAFDDLIGTRQHEELAFGASLYRIAASLCDFGIAPGPALAAHLETTVRRRRAFLIREPLAADAALSASGPDLSPRAAGFRLFLRATRAHVLSAQSGAGAALREFLAAHPDAHLTTAGYVRLDDAFAPLMGRIRQFGPGPDYRAILRASDLNLVIAGAGEAEDCRPETAWLDAARYGVATLASATRSHRAALVDGRDVALASDAAGWRSALETLAADAGRRAAIGRAARAKADSRHGPGAAAQDWLALIKALRGARGMRFA